MREQDERLMESMGVKVDLAEGEGKRGAGIVVVKLGSVEQKRAIMERKKNLMGKKRGLRMV